MVWNVKWTPEMDKYLKKADPKLSYTQIAADMANIFDVPLTRNSVIGRSNRLNLHKPAVKAGPKKTPKAPKPAPAEKKVKAKKEKKSRIEDPEVSHKDRIIDQMIEFHRLQGRTDFPNPEAKSISFDKLKPKSCRFPLGDKRTNDLRFCGADIDQTKNHPYCEYCYRIVYIPITDHKWRKKYASAD